MIWLEEKSRVWASNLLQSSSLNLAINGEKIDMSAPHKDGGIFKLLVPPKYANGDSNFNLLKCVIL